MSHRGRVPGKRVGTRIYVHCSGVAASRIPKVRVAEAVRLLPEGWDYQVVRWNAATKEVAFIQSPDWDAAPEPSVGDLIAVRVDGSLRRRMVNPERVQIYHHKWMFVSDDYQGFDVAESRARSKVWERLDLDRSRIGWRDYWEREVVPRIEEMGLEP